MSELTDLEICKRIAEIEGESIVVFDDFCILDELLHTLNSIRQCDDDSFMCALKSTQYNPLTDDGLCFRLMVKYKVDVDFTGDGYTRAWQYDHNDGQETLGKNPNKVICLAIIEASK